MEASALIRAAVTEPCLPWPRHVLSPPDWAQMAEALAREPTIALVALWADTGHVHAILIDEVAGEPLLASTPVAAGPIAAGIYAALSPNRPVAAWFERMVQDLWGHTAAGGIDQRAWLDHGRWPKTHPMALRPDEPRGRGEPPEFLAVADEELDQIPLGPIHGGIEPASHLRLTRRGETVIRLEARLGYTHKGTLTLMQGKSPRAAARFAARLSGESTVAHAIAFAQATEAALQTQPPPRAVALRAIMAEIERIGCHLGALAAIGEAAGFATMSARCGRYRETIHRAAETAFGHRLMMDCVIPGGAAGDIAPDRLEAVFGAVNNLTSGLPELQLLYDGGPLAARLSGVGTVSAEMANRVAAGGVIGRAAGRAVDARCRPGYDPYSSLNLSMSVLAAGDADARTRLRLTELGASIHLVRSLLAALPEGPVAITLPADSGEGVGFAESARGDVWHWLRLDHGQIASVFMRDPSWSHWPLFEIITEGSQVADLPLVQASFDLASSGVDL
jgi:Ni,Fe-hydrogenase III large subunit